MRVQTWPPVAASSVTVTMLGTLASPQVGRGAPDQSRQLRQPPSDPAEPDLNDLADINGGLAIRQTLREPPPGGQRQPPPVLVGQQGAKSEITSDVFETLVGSRWRSEFRDFAL